MSWPRNASEDDLVVAVLFEPSYEFPDDVPAQRHYDEVSAYVHDWLGDVVHAAGGSVVQPQWAGIRNGSALLEWLVTGVLAPQALVEAIKFAARKRHRFLSSRLIVEVRNHGSAVWTAIIEPGGEPLDPDGDPPYPSA